VKATYDKSFWNLNKKERANLASLLRETADEVEVRGFNLSDGLRARLLVIQQEIVRRQIERLA
jgi:hypothetical protein